MTVRRVMGIETEYGISVPGDPTANPMLLSGQVVNAYASRGASGAAKARWDYEDEAPLRDARGFEMDRQYADPSQLTDDEDPTLANVVLTNGARLYVDHAHPEYSSPEVTSPARRRDAGTGRGSGSCCEAVRRLAVAPGMPPREPLQEQHRRQGRVVRHARELPDAAGDAVRATSCGTSSRSSSPARSSAGPGRVGIGQDCHERGLPDRPALRLLRGRGRAWRRR